MNVATKLTSHDTDGTWKTIRQYLQLLLSLQGRKIPMMLGLSFVSSLFSGVGILLLVPLLDLVNGTDGPGAGVTRVLARAYDRWADTDTRNGAGFISGPARYSEFDWP